MAQGYGWLDAIVGSLRCANCAKAYGRGDLAVVGQQEGYVFVRCECRACRREGVAVVLVEYARAAGAPTRRQITSDDVLEAHEILASYGGNAEGLFLARTRGRGPA